VGSRESDCKCIEAQVHQFSCRETTMEEHNVWGF
jgi:hypothetical protein